jgi:hypothetical protein
VPDSNRSVLFEAKAAELVKATQGLPIPHLLQLRHLTLADPQSLRWANERELAAVFHIILAQAIEAVEYEELDAASLHHFDSLLPPGDEDVRDKDRWLLFELSKKRLSQPAVPVIQVTDPDQIAPPLAEEEPIVADGFAPLFDESLCRYVRRSLSVLATPVERAYFPKPFFLVPGFVDAYEQALRQLLLADIRGVKRLRALAASRDWAKESSGRILGMVQNGDDSNPILESWDSRWGACVAEGVGARKELHGVWDIFRDHAAKGGYEPPTDKDIPLLRTLLRWEAESLNDGWREMAQNYQQEFAPASKHDQARPGAFRDCVVKWIRALPAGGGDMLAIKAFFVLPKCDRMFLRSLIQTLGMSDAERRRVGPLVIRFYEGLPP